ncbi:MAG: T9SS type A sorting domain-containing protein [Chitinophagaceae bacterium]|nr:T9SS type A sorting domain-containing protein [Chitinophagaceae bacterium]
MSNFVYPNPTNGIVTIAEFSSPKQSIIIRVLDFSGKELYLENIGNITGTFSKQLDLSNFSQGTYLLELIHNGQREVKKLVIQK